MSIVAGLMMVGAGTLCLSGAVATRRWIAIVASLVMLLAMIDTAFLFVMPVIVWSGLLLAAGLLLGISLRFGDQSPDCDALVASPTSYATSLERSVMVSAALSYPATAWLLLAHGGGPEVGASLQAVAGSHVGHHSGVLTGSLPALVIAGLAVVLLVLASLALRHRRTLLSADAGGMALMLTIMLLMH